MDWKFGKTQYGFLKTATSGGTLTLVANSKQFQIFTGSAAHTMVLPDATTTSNGSGILFTVINESTGAIAVQYNNATSLTSVVAGSSADIILTSTSTSNGVWRVSSYGGSAGGGMGGGANAQSSNYSIVSGDKGKVIEVDSSGGAVNITLPAPSAGFVVTIKDAVGQASTNNISILRNGTESIDSVAENDVITLAWGAFSYISDGTNWFRLAEFNPNGGNGSEGGGPSPTPAAGRVILMGDNPSGTMEYYNMAVLGNGTNFGNLIAARSGCNGQGPSSATRIMICGGAAPSAGSPTSACEYVNYASLGNGQNFGNLQAGNENMASMSSGTRGVVACGYTGSSNLATMEYFTFTTLSNSTSFGTCASGGHRDPAGFSSPTRGVFGGGGSGTGSGGTLIDYITLATTGNSTSFGNQTTSKGNIATGSSATRGIWAGGESTVRRQEIDYTTIATTGNSTSFGNLSQAIRYAQGASNSIRFTCNSGNASSGDLTTMEYITIATTGNSTSFGNLTADRTQGASNCNAHGGL